MTEIYFKNRIMYANGDLAKDYAYYRVRDDGDITIISMSRGTVKKTNTLILPKGFETSSKEEFESARTKLLTI